MNYPNKELPYLAVVGADWVSLAVWRLVEESVLVAWVSSVLTGELPEGGEKADWMKGDAHGEGLEAEDEPRKLPLAVRPLRTVVRESEREKLVSESWIGVTED